MTDQGAALRSVVAWVFIALVALFLTQPASEPRSLYAQPLPMPPGVEVPGLLP